MRETNPLSSVDREERTEAEIGIAKMFSKMIRLPEGYETHIVDPRTFMMDEDDIPGCLGIVQKGKILGVTSREDLDECIIVTPTQNEHGRLGVAIQSSPKLTVSPELGVSIDGLIEGVESMGRLINNLMRAADRSSNS